MLKKIDNFFSKNFKLWWSYIILLILIILAQFNNIIFDILGFSLSVFNLFLLLRYGSKNNKIKE